MFILIPIGHESSTVRRQPWISYAIILINVLVFFLFTHNRLGNPETQRYLFDIVRYAIEHPHTELNPEFKAIIPEEVLAKYEAARLQLKDQMPRPYEDDLLEEQYHLDELTEKLLDIYRADRYRRWGYIPAEKGRIYTLITNLFFHGGFMHLLGNMIIFYLCGPFVEDRWGRTLFGGFYLVSGIVATLAHGLLTDTPRIPLVGASGAIAGVMGTFLILFFKTKIRFFFLLFPVFFIRGRFSAPAFVVLPLWFGQQYYQAVTAVNSPVAFWAHVGGFIFGCALALVMKFLAVEEKYISPDIEEKITVFQAHPLFEKALQLREEGQAQQAMAIMKQILAENPDDLNALHSLLEIYLDAEDEESVKRVGSRLIHLCLKENQWEEAFETYNKMNIRDRYLYPGPETLFNLATALEKAGEVTEAHRVHDELIRVYPKHLLALKSSVKLGRVCLNDNKNYREAFSYFVLAKYHPESDNHLLKSIEDGIKQARELGGPDVARLSESDVEGLAVYEEKGAELSIRLKIESSRLTGLTARGIRVKGRTGSDVSLTWPEIILLSVAVVGSGAQRKTLIIDMFNENEQGKDASLYAGYRLNGETIPLHKLFKKDTPPAKAFKILLGFLGRHITSPTIPSREALRRFDLPRYESQRAYESAVCQQLTNS